MIVEKIKKYVPDEKVRGTLIDKVRAIQWSDNICSQMTKVDGNAAALAPLLEANAFYINNTFQICNGRFFSNRSMFQNTFGKGIGN